MNADEMLHKIRTLIAAELKLPLVDVMPERRITEDLGADSLRKVECVMKIEEAFSVEISDIESRSVISVRDFVGLIESKTKKAKLHQAKGSS